MITEVARDTETPECLGPRLGLGRILILAGYVAIVGWALYYLVRGG